MTSKAYFLQLTILFGAMIGGVVVFILFAMYVKMTGEGPHLEYLNDTFQWLIPAFGLGAILLHSVVFKWLIGSIATEPELTGKMDRYRSAQIIRLAIFESAAIFGVIGYFMTNGWIYLAVSVFMLGMMTFFQPGINRAIDELSLTGEEASKVQDPQAIIASHPKY